MRKAPGHVVLINADDFGMSAEVNDAVAWAWQQRLISSASLMANMPGFEQACALARSNGLVRRLGVHLNLTEGVPLTREIREIEVLCQGGEFAACRRPVVWLSRRERRAIKAEFEAQINACFDKGINPVHLDSHHHVHTAWPIGRIVLGLAQRFGVCRVRLAENCRRIGVAKTIYKDAFNWIVRTRGLSSVSRFCGCDTAESVLPSPGAGVEVMVHPVLSGAGVPIDATSGLELEALLRPLAGWLAHAEV
jgi:predicted glycoside hydrolase/deacetylase ChbG (UPF0249 family)